MYSRLRIGERIVLPRMREWIEIFSHLTFTPPQGVLPRMREWIEIACQITHSLLAVVLSRMREWIEIAIVNPFFAKRPFSLV